MMAEKDLDKNRPRLAQPATCQLMLTRKGRPYMRNACAAFIALLSTRCAH